MNTHRGIRRIAFRPLAVIVGVVGFVSMGATHVMAADYGVANDTNQAIVFDASTLATVATIPLPGTNFGVTVMPNQSLAFVSRDNNIYVIDLTQHPPALAAGVNPIVSPIANIVEDLSLTADGRFLVVTDGGGGSAMGVINTATRTVVGTFSFLPDQNSVDVCEHGSVLVTSFTSRVVKRLTISAAGALVDRANRLRSPALSPTA
jgi:WD40 repeat protein